MSADEIKAAKKAYDAKRYLEKKSEIDARNSAWNKANKEKRKEIWGKYKETNTDLIRARAAEWRASNPEKARAAIADWRLRNPDYNSNYYKKNKESLKESVKAWAAKNRESCNARSMEWYKNNPHKKDEKRENNRRWVENNPAKVAAYVSKRRSAKMLRTPKWYGELDEFVMEEAYALCAARKISTGIAWQLDHKLPLQCDTVSGLHCWNNVQVIPARLNLSKQNLLKFVSHSEWINAI